MNAITKINQPQAVAAISHNPLMPTNMDSAIRLAEIMATGKLVPVHLQNKPGDCLMVIEQAMRWNMSPFAVAQCTSVIQGRLNYEGKLVAAVVQSAPGVMASRFQYEFSGEGDTRQVTASGLMRGDDKPKSVTVVLKDVRTNNEMWKKQPDQQLVYSANRIWARRYAPEVMLGVYSPDEFERLQPEDFRGQTIDAAPVRQEPPRQQQQTQRRAPDPLGQSPRAEPAPATAIAAPIDDEIPDFDMPPFDAQPQSDSKADLANRIIADIESCTTMKELDAIQVKYPKIPASVAPLINTAFKAARHGFETQVEAAIS